MNRLVLIGNGFDLALGLKTGYLDFLIWLIKKHILLASKSGPGEVNGSRFIGYSKTKLFSITLRNSYQILESDLIRLQTLNAIAKYQKSLGIEIKYDQYRLFYQIYSNAHKWGWVDIEEKYYNMLKLCLTKGHYSIEELNEELSELSAELEEYLLDVTRGFNYSYEQLEQMVCQFNAPVEKEYISYTNEHYSDIPKKICFLNFNYTDSVREFRRTLQPRSASEIDVINIHGELDNESNPIIFGFGDEIDEHYKTMENKNDNKYFQHIKSFGYFTTSNYHDMLRFLEEDEYQVFIYGHSCGLSDRTLLKEVFEHENCKSIKIFYYRDEYGKDDFRNKTMEISRHFENKGEMRKKIMSKQFSEAIPQWNQAEIAVNG